MELGGMQKKDIEEINQSRNKDLKQWARANWEKLGDDNTTYYQGIINGRKVSNAIPGIDVDGVWVSKPNMVKKEVLNSYRRHFTERFKRRPGLSCEVLKMVPIEKHEALVRPFSKQEIKEAVFFIVGQIKRRVLIDSIFGLLKKIGIY